MKVRMVVFVVGILSLLTVAVKQAHADWLVSPVTPQSLSADGRTFHVSIRNVRGAKECRITIRFAPNSDAIRKEAKATLRLTPTPGVTDKPASPRVTMIPLQETREKDRLIYTFLATQEQLSRLKFEFWDRKILGGTLFAINLSDFVLATP